ncbi:MAG TPA: response regulator, partial [Baekduia sp.]|nr:response regulator [Baekduia sp.]
SDRRSHLAIHTTDLGKRFGERTALAGVDLEVPRGTAFGFLGANGAGKTTLIRLLLAVRAASEHAPDVVLMDIRMPGMDGIEATRRLPRQRVLILTTFGLDEDIIDALRAGASGFLLKDAPTQEVVAAVRSVAAGDAVLSPAVTRQLLDQVGRRLPAAVSREPAALAALTDREQQVLRMLE